MRNTNHTITTTVNILALLALSTVWVGAEPANRADGRNSSSSRFKQSERYHEPPRRQLQPCEGDLTGRVRYWNEIAYNASGLDHTAVAPGENRVFGEQFGPCRASRALAIVQIAVFDAVNAIKGGYQSYTGLRPVSEETSMDAAIAQAAHDTLVALFPSQTPRLDALLVADLKLIRERRAKANGIALGKRAAAAILALRVNDGSQIPEPRIGIEFFPSTELGHWQPDPIAPYPLALGAYWGQVAPFVLTAANQYRIAPPPALDSPEFLASFLETKSLGGDGVITPTQRTPEQTVIGTYWAYDGTPSLCAPPRLYNQITTQIAHQMHSDEVELARLLAVMNVALADTGIVAWESKYYYDFWRPVTGIRAFGAGIGDPNFTPLGAPASNLSGANFTPPFPTCPSGHASFGGALFQTLRRFYRTDNIAFTFVSDELNGVTVDSEGNLRPLIPRSFTSLSAAELENGQSRIYLGIHWRFDASTGIGLGNKVADYVLAHAFQPVKPNAPRR